MTLASYLEEKARQGTDATLLALIEELALATIAIAGHLRVASIKGLVGATGAFNVQGEEQKPLDILANDIFMAVCQASPTVSYAVSEELPGEVALAETGRYAVIFDPLDGSSNLDVNGTVGSIVSIIEAQSPDEILQPGRHQLFAAYAAYGPSTSLVLTFGDAVAIFSLDTDGAYRLTARDLSIPHGHAEFSINAARQGLWETPVQNYISALTTSDGSSRRYTMRWMGSLVADIHRILHRGGIFLYPGDSETGLDGGKLRLLYEANPIGLIMEAAGGRATTGRADILDLTPSHLHQRISLITGARDEVDSVLAHYSQA